jgi:septal ring factor EnvC (AmiA/AmiB activator)
MGKIKLTEKERIKDRIEMFEWEIRNNEEENQMMEQEIKSLELKIKRIKDE